MSSARNTVCPPDKRARSRKKALASEDQRGMDLLYVAPECRDDREPAVSCLSGPAPPARARSGAAISPKGKRVVLLGWSGGSVAEPTFVVVGSSRSRASTSPLFDRALPQPMSAAATRYPSIQEAGIRPMRLRAYSETAKAAGRRDRYGRLRPSKQAGDDSTSTCRLPLLQRKLKLKRR